MDPPDGLPVLTIQLAPLARAAPPAHDPELLLFVVDPRVTVAVITTVDDGDALLVLHHHRLIEQLRGTQGIPPDFFLREEGELVVAREVLSLRRVDHRHAELRPEVVFLVGDLAHGDEIRVVAKTEVGAIALFAVHLVQQFEREQVPGIEHVRHASVAGVSEVIEGPIRHHVLLFLGVVGYYKVVC